MCLRFQGFNSEKMILVFSFALCLLVMKVGLVTGSEEKLWEGVWQKQSIDCKHTYWLHLPKTSSMFCLSIQHACCPAKYEELTAGVTTEKLTKSVITYRNADAETMGYNSSFCYHFYRAGHPTLECEFAGPVDHRPLLSRTDLRQEMGMAIIREPKSRAISAFMDGIHKEGFPHRPDYWALRAQFDLMDKNKSVPALENTILKAQMYANHPLLKGLQIKLLIGDPIVDFTKTNDIPKLEEMLKLAIERLRQFFFVGIFDEYVRSMKLFHALANVGKFCFSCCALCTSSKFIT